MAVTAVVGKLEVVIPYSPLEARGRLLEIFQNDRTVYRESQFGAIVAKPNPYFILAHKDPVKRYVVIIHDYGEVTGPVVSTRFGVEVEPSNGTSARAAAEHFWMRLSTATRVHNGSQRPRLETALTECNGTGWQQLEGRLATSSTIIGESQDIQIALAVGVVGAIVQLILIAAVTRPQLPAALWALVPFSASIVAAMLVIVFGLKRKVILWRIK